MIGSLFAGVSGLSANASAMSVIGDNIANVNTTSFKSNRSSFANILSQSLSGSSGNDIGRGVQFWGTNSLWTQGSLENTNSPTDLAINGRGFFMVKDDVGATYYTRAGEFRFDKDGNMVNPDGLKVQGYAIDSNGLLGSISDICIPTGSVSPSPTDEMITTINLNADTTAEASATGVLDGLLTITAESGLSGNITVNLVDGAAVGEVTNVVCNAESTLAGGEYFTISAPGTDYYVWYDIDNGSIDPAPAGFTGIEVDIASGDTAEQVATKTANAIAALADFNASAADETLTITNATGGDVTDTADNDTGFTLSTSIDGLDVVTAGNETVTVVDSTMTVRIQDGVSTQQNISDAIAGEALISSVVPAAAGDVWTLNAGTDSVTLAGGADGGTYSSTITVYDSLGNDIALTLDFVCNETGWDWTATSSIGTCNASGTLQFDEAGNLSFPTTNPVLNITDLNGASPLAIEWNLIDSNGTITGYASPSSTTFLSQNGYAPGILQSTSVNEQGLVTGTFSNGQLKPLYQIVLADFSSYQGLAGIGKNLYSESLGSGNAVLGTAGNGRLGTISPNALEMSNVDLAAEFVKMITTQRAFQANSKVITTSDEILADLINIKR